LKVTIT